MSDAVRFQGCNKIVMAFSERFWTSMMALTKKLMVLVLILGVNIFHNAFANSPFVTSTTRFARFANFYCRIASSGQVDFTIAQRDFTEIYCFSIPKPPLSNYSFATTRFKPSTTSAAPRSPLLTAPSI